MSSMEMSLNSFKYNIILLKILGLYPVGYWPRLYKLYSHFVFITFMVFVPLLPVVKLAIDKETNIQVVAQDLCIATQLLVVIFKVLPVKENPDKVKRSIFILNDDIFNNYIPEQNFILEEIVINCKRIFGVYCVTFASTALYWTVKPLLTKEFPLKIWLPFETEDTLVYISVYTFIAVGGAYGAMSNISLDTVIPLLIYHAVGQLRLLKDTLTYLSERTEDQVSKEGKTMNHNEKQILRSDIIYKKICMAVDHYDFIYEYVSNLEEIFAWAIFSQFIGSVVTICIYCFLLSVVPPMSVQFFGVVSSIVVLLVELFLSCYAGALLNEESITIINAIYMSEWYTYDAKSMKALVILMERTKRPMKVTAGKIFDLSLDTFTMIIRKSYSLLAVLRNN